MDGENQQCHPALQITEILERIFVFCGAQDLTSCRQMSKLWESASRDFWRASAQVKLNSSNKIAKYVAYLKHTEKNAIHENFSLSDDYTEDVWRPFWKLCGANVTVLELYRCTFPSVVSFRNVICEWTPNLKKLVLRSTYIVPNNKYDWKMNDWAEPKCSENVNLKTLTLDIKHSHSGSIDISWDHLLSHYPGLQIINMEVQHYQLDLIFEAILTIRRKDTNKLKFTEIRTLLPEGNMTAGGGISDEIISVLTNPNLNLKAISVAVCGQRDGLKLGNILEENGTSLRSLELYRRFSSYGWLDPVPIFNQALVKFENLTEIILDNRVFSSLAFLKFTPNLARLKIHAHDVHRNSTIIAQTKPEEMENVRLKYCREFEYDKVITVDQLERLMEWLPNVEHLTMPMDDTTFTKTCERWTKLTKLVIPQSYVSESAITGLDSGHVKMINDGQGSCDGRPATVPRANITCLRNVKTLVMSAYLSHPPLNLGNTACCAIKELPSLEKLTVEGYQFQEKRIWSELHAAYQN